MCVIRALPDEPGAAANTDTDTASDAARAAARDFWVQLAIQKYDTCVGGCFLS